MEVIYMQKEDQIIGMLEQIMSKLDEHGRILGEHTKKLDEHTQILGEHTKKLDKYDQKLDDHSSILQDHARSLTALLSGQEHLKAEIDGMKIASAKEFGELKEGFNNISTHFELLREDTWQNKVDINRIQKTMGMK